MEYQIRTTERVDGYLKTSQKFIRLQNDPFRIYVKGISPNEGLELLYNESVTGKDAVINPNGFPWFTLWLDPLGSRVRSGHHHSIFHAGYRYFTDIIQALLQQHKHQLEQVFSLTDPMTHEGHQCFKVSYNSPNYHIKKYTAKGGESVSSLADQLKLSSYKILALNKELHSFGQTLSSGQTINIPSHYAQKIFIYVKKENYLPITIEVFDEKGKFQSYTFSNIKLNPKFSEQTFSLNNPTYNF
jgi:hypothetical protein